MCGKGDCKIRQHKNNAAKVCACDMKDVGESFVLDRTIGRKRNAMSTMENMQQDESAIDDSRVKYGLPDDRSQPRRILRQKPDEEEVCVTPVKPSHVFASDKNENSAGRDFSSLPFDVLVKVVCNLGHHELDPVSRVSKDLKQAVKVANETHFPFKTPDQRRRPNRSLFLNECPEEIFPRSDSPSGWLATPMAPKRVEKHRNVLLNDKDLAELSRELFLDGDRSSSVDAEHTISLRSGIATNRVLFTDDEISGEFSRHCI